MNEVRERPPDTPVAACIRPKARIAVFQRLLTPRAMPYFLILAYCLLMVYVLFSIAHCRIFVTQFFYSFFFIINGLNQESRLLKCRRESVGYIL